MITPESSIGSVPGPFTESEWRDLFTIIGITGHLCAEVEGPMSTAILADCKRCAAALQRVFGDEAYVRMLIRMAEAASEQISDS